MGLGNDMMAEAMIDQMIAEEEAEQEKREALINGLCEAIAQANTIQDLKILMFSMLELIRKNI